MTRQVYPKILMSLLPATFFYSLEIILFLIYVYGMQGWKILTF